MPCAQPPRLRQQFALMIIRWCSNAKAFRFPSCEAILRLDMRKVDSNAISNATVGRLFWASKGWRQRVPWRGGGRGADRLAHGASHLLLQPPGLVDEIGGAGQHRTHRRAQPFGELLGEGRRSVLTNSTGRLSDCFVCAFFNCVVFGFSDWVMYVC